MQMALKVLRDYYAKQEEESLVQLKSSTGRVPSK